ncbi:hypothetical protein A8B75_05630 [Sphingomonadales bacterium EhC05]|nr:hypothetical protein A8B75_05630 [Sphingomonadales bacterium EhC05]
MEQQMKTWICRISIFLNLLVITAGVALWLNIGEIFKSVYLEPHAANRVGFFEGFPVKSGDIVMLGDSITEQAQWEDIFPGLPIKNRGIGGDITSGVLARLDGIVAARPSKIFIKIGTNDLTHGSEKYVSYKQYREIVSKLKTSSPGTQVYLQSILPRGADYRAKVEAFNSQIKKIADDLDVTYVDLYPSFLADDGSIRDELSSDELHINGAGYKIWKSLLAPHMESKQTPSTAETADT